MSAVTRRRALSFIPAFGALLSVLASPERAAAEQGVQYSGPGLYAFRGRPDEEFYVGPMPKGRPFGRAFVQAHRSLATYPDPKQAFVIFAKARAVDVLACKLSEVRP